MQPFGLPVLWLWRVCTCAHLVLWMIRANLTGNCRGFCDTNERRLMDAIKQIGRGELLEKIQQIEYEQWIKTRAYNVGLCWYCGEKIRDCQCGMRRAD